MNTAMLIWIVIIGACIGVYYLYRQGRLPWLKGVRMLKIFEPKAETQIERLNAQTEKEMARAKELRDVLKAKRALAGIRAENIRLIKAIDGVSEKSVEKERQDEQKAQEVQKVKPRRL